MREQVIKRVVIAAVVLVVSLLLAGAIYISQTSLPEQAEENGENENPATSFRVETVADNLEAPWSIDFTDEDDIFFTERPGRIRMIDDGELVDEALLTLPSAAAEGGALGLALDPNFETERYVYIYYTTDEETNRISRYRYIDNLLADEETLIDDIPASSIHNGGRLRFGPDGKLYAGTGDAGTPDLAQDPESLAGKILRLNRDGSVPVDNPRADSYVFTLGHRNVQGLAWSEDGQMFATEHGPQGQDEINQIAANSNYGWPVVTGSVELGPNTDAPVGNYRNPIIDSGSETWAPSGLEYYTDTELPAIWHNRLVFSGLRSQTLWRLSPNGEDLESLLEDEYGRLRDVRTAPDGSLYILTSNRDGRGQPENSDDRILRLVPGTD